MLNHDHLGHRGCALVLMLLLSLVACEDAPPPPRPPQAASSGSPAPSPGSPSANTATKPGPKTAKAPQPIGVAAPPIYSAKPTSTARPASSGALPAVPDTHKLDNEKQTARTSARAHFSLASDLLAITANQNATLITLRGKPEQKKLAPNASVLDVALSTSGKHAALWMADGSVEIYDTMSGSLTKKLPVAKPPANMDYPVLRWSGDDKWLAAADQKWVHVWNVAEGKLRQSFDAWVITLGFGYDGHRLVGTNPATVWVWDPYTGRQLDERSTRTGGTFLTAASPDGNWVASAEEDGHGATLYETRPWQLKSVLVNETTCDAHTSVRFARDSDTVLVSGGSKWLRAYRTKTTKPYASWQAPDDIYSAIMSDNGKFVLAEIEGNKALAFEVASNKRTHTFEGMERGNWLLSPDGRLAVFYSADRARIWAMMDGGQLLDATIDE